MMWRMHEKTLWAIGYGGAQGSERKAQKIPFLVFCVFVRRGRGRIEIGSL
jgi:hypothetical protein